MYIPVVLLSALAVARAAVPVLVGPQSLYQHQAPVLQLGSPSYSLEVPYPAIAHAGFFPGPAVTRVFSDASGGSFVVITDDNPDSNFVHSNFRSGPGSILGGHTRNFPSHRGPAQFSREQENNFNSFQHSSYRSQNGGFNHFGQSNDVGQGFPGPVGPEAIGREFGQPSSGRHGPGLPGGSPGGFQHSQGSFGGPEARGSFGSSVGGRPGPRFNPQGHPGSAGRFNQPQGSPVGPEARGHPFEPPSGGRREFEQPSGGFQRPQSSGGPHLEPRGRPSGLPSPQRPSQGFPSGPGQQAFSVNFEGSDFGYGYMVHGDNGPHPRAGSPQGHAFQPPNGVSTPPPHFGRPGSGN